MRNEVLTIDDLRVSFATEEGLVRAVDGVSLAMQRGRITGIVGESGCGKSVTSYAILQLIQKPGRLESGTIWFYPSDGEPVEITRLDERSAMLYRIRGGKISMIFQDSFSSLNPRLTVREIVGEPLVIHGLARGTELEERVTDMLQRVGLKPEHRTRYPHAFSGGQRQRIGIARALIMRPALVICDEAVSALDVSIQAQVINLLQELQAELGLTYLFIAHDLSVVKHLCDRIAVMYAGRLVELAPTQALFSAPQHPYTTALLASVPNPDPDQKMAGGLTGEVADPGDLPPGCAFHPRCPARLPHCAATVPELAERLAGRCVACHLFGVSAKR